MTENASAAAAEGKEAGRGVLYIAFAKFYFMVVGAVIEFGLPSLVSAAVFGAYRVVVSLVSPLNNVLITGTIQSVSRFTAQRPDRAREVQRTGFRMHLMVGLPLAVGFIAMAPVFAHLFRDTSKTGPFMLAGVIVGAYAFYAVFIGSANGRRHFHKQAGLDITMATLRAAGILGLAAAGLGVIGAVSGWVAAAGLILLIAALVIGLPGKASEAGEDAQPLRPVLRFFLGVAVYLILLNLIMFIDTYLLKRLAADWFAGRVDQIQQALSPVIPTWLGRSIGALEPAHLADVQVGHYAAVQNLARLSYQAIIAVTFVVFPLVSRTTFAEDREATRRYVQTTLRYSFTFAALIAAVLAANPERMLDVIYPAAYARAGGHALVALAFGNVAFALFAISGTILNGAGLTRHAITMASITLALAASANAIVIPRMSPGPDLLLACGAATASAMLVGAGVGTLFLRKKLGASLPPSTLARVVVAIAVALGVGRLLPGRSSLVTLGEGAIVGLAFLATLILTRELTAADLRAVLSLSRRKGA